MEVEIRPLLKLPAGRERAGAAIFLSGGGSNAERLLEKCRIAGPAAPFDPLVLVTDAPETSRAAELSRAYGVPLVGCDIREFYRRHGEPRVSLATPAGRQLRAEWTDELRRRLAPYPIDFGVLAGFVPLTNITADFPCLNVHPGDLTWLKDGRRHLVGLHTVPVERAILEGLPSLRSSVILALPYTENGSDMDNGPILGLSPEVPVDLAGFGVDELQRLAAARPERRPPGGFGDALEKLANANLDRLKESGDWVVFPPVVFDFAAGSFGLDAAGLLHYRLGRRWQPVETVVYGRTEREIVFRSAGLTEEGGNP